MQGCSQTSLADAGFSIWAPTIGWASFQTCPLRDELVAAGETGRNITMTASDLANILGLAGVSLVVSSYFLLQIGKVKVEQLRYSLTNAFASVFVLTSLVFHWNLSSAVIEGFWLIISLYGCVKWVAEKRTKITAE